MVARLRMSGGGHGYETNSEELKTIYKEAEVLTTLTDPYLVGREAART